MRRLLGIRVSINALNRQLHILVSLCTEITEFTAEITEFTADISSTVVVLHGQDTETDGWQFFGLLDILGYTLRRQLTFSDR